MNAKQAIENQDIVIFRAGKHMSSEGIKAEFSEKNLDDIINNTDISKVALVIHHPKTTSYSLGGFKELKRMGKDLVARLKDVPLNFANSIKDGLFPTRSIKIDNNSIEHLGFLPVGVNPAVSGMPAIQFEENQNIMSFNNSDINFKKEVSKMENEKIKDLEAKVADLENKLKEANEKILSFEESTELAESTAGLNEANDKLAKAEAEIKEMKDKLEAEKMEKVKALIEAKLDELGIADETERENMRNKFMSFSEKTDEKEFSEYLSLIGGEKKEIIVKAGKMNFEKKEDSNNTKFVDYANKI